MLYYCTWYAGILKIVCVAAVARVQWLRWTPTHILNRTPRLAGLHANVTSARGSRPG
jgi:hypothetical protein